MADSEPPIIAVPNPPGAGPTFIERLDALLFLYREGAATAFGYPVTPKAFYCGSIAHVRACFAMETGNLHNVVNPDTGRLVRPLTYKGIPFVEERSFPFAGVALCPEGGAAIVSSHHLPVRTDA